MSLDGVILWHGTLQSLKDDQKKDFVDVATRIDRTYSGTYEQALKLFKRSISKMHATGVYYFNHSMPGQDLHYFKGYPVREKINKELKV